MSDVDPVLEAWHLLREAEAGCPTPGDLVLAARSGPERLLEPARRHLTEAPCAHCETVLLSVWELDDPSPAVLAAATTFASGSAYGAALRRHVVDCDSSACAEAAAALAGAPITEASEAEKQGASRAQNLLRRAKSQAEQALAAVGAVLVPGGSMMPQASMGTSPEEMSRHGYAVRAPRECWFGGAVRLTVVPGRDDQLRVEVNFDRLEMRYDAITLLVLLTGRQVPLAAVDFTTAAGRQTDVLALPASTLELADLHIAIGVASG